MKKILLLLLIFFLFFPSFAKPKFKLEKKEPKKEIFFEKAKTEKEKLEKEKTEKEDLKERMPQGKFLSPEKKEKVEGEIEISFEIENALEVEFYLRRPEALAKIYLAKGKKENEKLWKALWKTKLTPNGEYFLFAQITNEYGTYEGRKIRIFVENEIKKKKEKIKEIEEIEEKMEEFEKKEKEFEKREEKIKEKVEKEIKERPKKILPLFPKELKEKVQKTSKATKEKIEKLKEILEKESKIKKELKKVKVKEKLKKKLEEIQVKKGKVKKEIEKEIETTFESFKKVLPQKEKELEKEKTKTKEKITNFLEELEKTIEEKKEFEEEKEKKFAQDSDFDGLPDFEEIRLKTDPFNPDSDGDGFLDGSEIKLGFNPLKPSPADKIKYQDPRKTKAKISKKLKVEKIEIVFLEKEKEALKISGKALPFSFVTLYIYSLPTIVITRADSQGYWEYILDKPLADGQHVIYAAITNNLGEIEEKSEPLVFAKKGKNLIRLFEPQKEKTLSPVKVLQRNFAILVIGLVTLALGIALIIISFLIREKKK